MARNQREKKAPLDDAASEGLGAGLDKAAFRSFCEAANEGILLAEIGTKRPLYANPAIAQMFGYTLDEIQDLNITDLHPPDVLPSVERDFETLLKGESDKTIQPCLRKDGSVFTGQIHAWPVTVDGRSCAVGFFEDITERERLEENLKERVKEFTCLERIAEAVESTEGLERVFQVSVNALSEAFLYADIACARITLEDQCWQSEPFSETEWRLSADLKVQGEPVGAVDVFYQDDRPVRDEGPFLNEERRLLSLCAERLGRIIERLWAKDELRNNKKRLELAMEGGGLGVWDWDPKTDEVVYSDRWAQMLEYAPDEVKPNVEFFKQHVHPDDLPAVLERLVGHVEGQLPVYESEHRMRTKSGTWLWIHDHGKVVRRDSDGRPVRVAGVIRDITRQHRNNLELQRTQFVVDKAPVSVFWVSPEGEFLYVNEKAAESLGYTREELLQMSVKDLASPKAGTELDGSFSRLLEEGALESDVYLQRKDGSDFEVLLKVVAIDEKRFIGIFSDISERKEAERALEQSELRFKKMLSVIPDMFSIHDPDMNIVYSNWNGFASVPEEKRILNTKCYRTYRGYDDICPDCRATVVVETGQPHEETVKLPDGRWFDIRVLPILNDMGDCEFVVECVRDVTEQIEIQERVRQMEKMDAIGKLAGGVAHDFNNQLSAVMGYADMLRMSLEDPELKTFAESILIASRRAGDLTKKLLAFARKGNYKSVPVDIHEVIHEVVDILNHSVSKKIDMHQSFKANPPVTLGDPGQIQNALLNLALNAADAMPDGGELIFETSVKQLTEDDGQAFSSEISPGAYLRVCVTDNGAGISKENLNHIFEPFFTTKDVGKGTGMGLAAVFGTVKQMGGAIDVSSEVGHGTTFRLYLPVEERAAERRQPGRDVRTAQRNAQILVIDDEDLFRDLAKNLLTSLNYRVHVEENGKAGVEYFRRHWREVDLVILDMVMPVMDGPETYQAMKAIDSDVRVLLASGYSINGMAQELLNQGVRGFLEKPFEIEEMSTKVADALS
ncbi:MAG: PAS domain S-box protein [Planctomycetes bacterium]|jgi:PAS domain S-box-containing protein|nr:PAS domain S-box protein [Planctomycetota bacterium]